MNRLAMKIRFLSAIVFGVALTLSAFSQDANPGQRGGRGGWGGMSGGDGITGTVTEVAADHYIIKTDGGETYTCLLYTSRRREDRQSVSLERSFSR